MKNHLARRESWGEIAGAHLPFFQCGFGREAERGIYSASAWLGQLPSGINSALRENATCGPSTAAGRIFFVAAISAALLWAPAESTGAEGNSTDLPAGVTYQNERLSQGPWSIHVVKAERSNHELTWHTTLGRGRSIGLSTLSDQIRMLPPEMGQPIAGITGDYFYKDYPYLGDPKGLQIFGGELVSAPCDWTCFWIDPKGNPHMGVVTPLLEVTWTNGKRIRMGLNEERASDTAVLYTRAVGASTHARGGREFILEKEGDTPWLPLRAGQRYSARVQTGRDRGDTPLSTNYMVLSLGNEIYSKLPPLAPGAVLRISTATLPNLAGVDVAIGGGPALIHNGKPIVESGFRWRHPRTAFGWSDRFYFLVEVDGRQRGLSVGMTFQELGKYMLSLGCTEALNLDGGGSAECWVTGHVVNSPSEGRERPMGNALVLVRKQSP